MAILQIDVPDGNYCYGCPFLVDEWESDTQLDTCALFGRSVAKREYGSTSAVRLQRCLDLAKDSPPPAGGEHG